MLVYACVFLSLPLSLFLTLSHSTHLHRSSYVYVFSVMGELPAYISAACLTLEYGISASAVARSWGEKLDVWTVSTFGYSCLPAGSYGGWAINLPAAILQALCVIILLLGVELSKKAINFFTTLKVLLIVFMIVCGFILFDFINLKVTGGLYDGAGAIGDQDPETAVSTGGTMTAIFTGATTCFFGYVGYDEVCCLSGEAIKKKSMPYAVFGTIILSTCLYILASLALVGMQSYHDIDTDSGFSEAFMAQDTHGWNVIGQITAIGELVALPLVVLISFMAQPRLLYAMSQDKLAPALFARANADGNLTESLLVSGAAFTILAAFIPFKYLENMVSAGILINFNLTNAAYILMRLRQFRHQQDAAVSQYRPPDTAGRDDGPSSTQSSASFFTSCECRELPWLLGWYNVLCIFVSVCLVNLMFSPSKTTAIPWACVGVFCVVMLYVCGCNISNLFKEMGGSRIAGAEVPTNRNSRSSVGTDDASSARADDAPFTLHAPFFPLIPLAGMLINWFLLAQLPLSGFAFLFGYFGLTLVSYSTTFCLVGQPAGGAGTAGASANRPDSAGGDKLMWASLAQTDDVSRGSNLSSSTHSMLHSEHIDVGIDDSGGEDDELEVNFAEHMS